MADARVPAPLQGRFDRAALERVLARASELQATTTGEPGEDLTEQQIIELGKEVGLSPEHLRQALAEERTRVVVPEEPGGGGMTARLYGPALAHAARTVPGTPAELLRTLDAWMQKQEGLVVKRQFPDRVLWEPRRDLVGSLQRAISARGRAALVNADEVAATAVAVDERRSLVQLSADLTPHRANLVRQGAAVAGFGAAGAGALIALHVMVPVAVIPAALLGWIGGYRAPRSMNARHVARAQLALEQLLDRLERGELQQKPSLLGALAAAAAAAALPRKI